MNLSFMTINLIFFHKGKDMNVVLNVFFIETNNLNVYLLQIFRTKNVFSPWSSLTVVDGR